MATDSGCRGALYHHMKTKNSLCMIMYVYLYAHMYVYIYMYVVTCVGRIVATVCSFSRFWG